MKVATNTNTKGIRVAIYFNLHKKVFSIKAMEGEKKGLVIGHATNVELANATFKVSEAGRQRVLREKRKNVHAYVIGELVNHFNGFEGNRAVCGEMITYNPYKGNTFVRVFNGEAVHEAKSVSLFTENNKGRMVIRQTRPVQLELF